MDADHNNSSVQSSHIDIVTRKLSENCKINKSSSFTVASTRRRSSNTSNILQTVYTCTVSSEPEPTAAAAYKLIDTTEIRQQTIEFPRTKMAKLLKSYVSGLLESSSNVVSSFTNEVVRQPLVNEPPTTAAKSKEIEELSCTVNKHDDEMRKNNNFFYDDHNKTPSSAFSSTLTAKWSNHQQQQPGGNSETCTTETMPSFNLYSSACTETTQAASSYNRLDDEEEMEDVDNRTEHVNCQSQRESWFSSVVQKKRRRHKNQQVVEPNRTASSASSSSLSTVPSYCPSLSSRATTYSVFVSLNVTIFMFLLHFPVVSATITTGPYRPKFQFNNHSPASSPSLHHAEFSPHRDSLASRTQSFTKPNSAQHLSSRRNSSVEVLARESGPPLCRTSVGELGVCMFLRPCMEMNGTLAGTCFNKFFFASCCILPENASTIMDMNGISNNINTKIRAKPEQQDIDSISSSWSFKTRQKQHEQQKLIEKQQHSSKRKQRPHTNVEEVDTNTVSEDDAVDVRPSPVVLIQSDSSVENGDRFEQESPTTPSTSTRTTPTTSTSTSTTTTTTEPSTTTSTTTTTTTTTTEAPTTSTTTSTTTTTTTPLPTTLSTEAPPTIANLISTSLQGIAHGSVYELLPQVAAPNLSVSISSAESNVPIINQDLPTSTTSTTSTATEAQPKPSLNAFWWNILANGENLPKWVTTTTTTPGPQIVGSDVGTPLMTSINIQVPLPPSTTTETTPTTTTSLTTTSSTTTETPVIHYTVAIEPPQLVSNSFFKPNKQSVQISTYEIDPPPAPPTPSALPLVMPKPNRNRPSQQQNEPQLTDSASLIQTLLSVLPSIDDDSSQPAKTRPPTSATRATTTTTALPPTATGSIKGNGEVNVLEACGLNPLYQEELRLQQQAGGFRREGRVVGGLQTEFGEFPWQASLRMIMGFLSSHRCGATLVHPRWVLTAAHCASDIPVNKMMVRLGEYDFYHTNKSFPHVEIRVEKRIIHKNFNFLTFENDIALLKLVEPVPLRPNIIPACIAPLKNYIGSYGTITGWGRLSQSGRLPGKMHKVSVPFITKAQCEDFFVKAGRPQEIEPCFICAGYRQGGRDACQGDSGGPMQQSIDGRWSLVGVISWGIGCAEMNLPGVSTLVPLYLDWILENSEGEVDMPSFYLKKYGRPHTYASQFSYKRG